MSRTVLLFSKGRQGWPSCVAIEAQLLQIYQKILQADSLFLPYNSRAELKRDSLIVKKILEFQPEQLIFLSHQHHPSPLLSRLAMKLSEKTKITFHIYGNWFLDRPQWESVLKNKNWKNLHFIVPSRHMGNEVSHLTSLGYQFVHVVPFPVQVEKFRFKAKVRGQMRRRQGVLNREPVLLFAGDFRDGKGALIALMIARDLFKRIPQLHFWTCGKIRSQDKAYWQKELDLTKKIMGRNFKHFGRVDQKTLIGVMQAADGFFLPSRYRFEAFGLTPIEALSSGLPILITSWMGFKDLPKLDEQINFLRVMKALPEAKINESEAQKKLLEILERPLPNSKREKNYLKWQLKFSDMSIAKQLKKLI